MSLQHDMQPKPTTRPGSLAALMEAVAGVGKAAGLIDDPPPVKPPKPAELATAEDYPIEVLDRDDVVIRRFRKLPAAEEYAESLSGACIVNRTPIKLPEPVESPPALPSKLKKKKFRYPSSPRSRPCLTIDIHALACEAHGRLVTQGGFTLSDEGNPATGNFWAVSLKDYEEVYPGIPSVEEIEVYLRSYSLDGQWFGGWHDKATNETHLDVTQLFGYKHTAMMVAEENDQKSIYNIETGEAVYVSQRALPGRRLPIEPTLGYHYNCPKCGTFWDANPSDCPNCSEACEAVPAFGAKGVVLGK